MTGFRWGEPGQDQAMLGGGLPPSALRLFHPAARDRQPEVQLALCSSVLSHMHAPLQQHHGAYDIFRQ
jgi:hypothetical protein